LTRTKGQEERSE